MKKESFKKHNTHLYVGYLKQNIKEFRIAADRYDMENRKGFSYLLPKSGSRSQKETAFFYA